MKKASSASSCNLRILDSVQDADQLFRYYLRRLFAAREYYMIHLPHHTGPNLACVAITFST